MGYPYYFYYTQAQAESVYQDTPTDDLDVNRLVNGLPCWKIPAPRELKPKKLVLADWHAKNWSADKIKRIQQRLSTLLTEGFEIFVWQDGGVQPLKKSDLLKLSRPQFRSEITLASDKELTQAAAQRHITQDQLLILDDYWLDVLLSETKYLPSRTLDLTDYMHLDGSQRETLMQLLKASYPPVTTIFRTDDYYCGQEITGTLDKLAKKFPHASVRVTFRNKGLQLTSREFIELIQGKGSLTHEEVSHITTLQVIGDDDQELNLQVYNALCRHLPELKTLSLLNFGFLAHELPSERLTSIEEFEFDSMIPLETALTLAPNLKTFRASAELQPTNLARVARCCPLLEYLECEASMYDTNHIVQLLHEFPNLKQLSIYNGINHVPDRHKIMPDKVVNLEGLKLLAQTHDPEWVEDVLTTALHLKTLELYVGNPLFNQLNLAVASLMDLKKIILSNAMGGEAKEQAENLVNLLMAAPELRELSVILSINGVLQLEPGSLPKLAVLDFIDAYVEKELPGAEVDVAPENIDALLLAAPNINQLGLCSVGGASGYSLSLFQQRLSNLKNLEQLTLSGSNLKGSNLLTGALQFAANSLANLKTLVLDSIDLSAANLKNLVEAAPAMTTLRLNWMSTVDGRLDLTANSLPALRVLQLGATMKSQQVNALFAAAPHLKTLCFMSSDILEYAPGSLTMLPELEELTITGAKLSPEQLANLLMALPNLKKLNLVGCFFQGDFSMLPENYLEKLRYVHLERTAMSPRSLQNLLQAAPNIKYKKKLAEDAKYVPPIFLSRTRNAGVNDPSGRDKKGKKNWVDANTDPKETHFHVKRIFYAIGDAETPKIENYRQDIFNQVSINPQVCSVQEAFEVRSTGELQLTDRVIQPCTTDVYPLAQELNQPHAAPRYYGRWQADLDEQWQAIPSLSPHEELTHFHSDAAWDSLEINYSQRDNQYYIRSKIGPQTINADFLLTVPNEDPPALPDDIQVFVNYFKRFKAEKLELASAELKGVDYINALIKQGKGACRHRAVAFKAIMAQECPDIPTRIVGNDVHMYAEVQIKGQWLACDLGGYPAQLSIDETNNPNQRTPFFPETHTRLRTQGNPRYQDMYQRALQTWLKTCAPFMDTPLAFCQFITQQGIANKRLIELDSTASAEAMTLLLQQYCKHTNRPVFYVHSPDDLICNSPYIERQQTHHIGLFRKGPGGRLYDFLQQHRNSRPPAVLVVNYERFAADDIVRFNGLLDKAPHADGVPLPNQMQVIGVTNLNKPDCYQGADFYSRFDDVYTNPVAQDQLVAAIPPLPVTPQNPEEPVRNPINLFHSPNWQDYLLGRWVMNGKQLVFKEGALQQALSQGNCITIQNGLWENSQFKRFWQQACLQGNIQYAGQTIPIPDNFRIICQEGYDWQQLTQCCTLDDRLQANAPTVNPTLFGELFGRYPRQVGSGPLKYLPGYIEAAANNTLSLNITRRLSADDWGRLLTECQKYHVTLQVHTAPSVEHYPFLPNIQHQQTEQTANPSTEIIESTDSDTTVTKLNQAHSGSIVIDVSECSASDLLYRVEPKLNQKQLKFAFKQTKSALLKALEANKTVILTGRFSAELIDALSPLLLERQTPQAKGRLFIVCQEKDPFNLLPVKRETVTAQDKLACLGLQDAKELTPYCDEPLSRLQTRWQFLKNNPNQSSEDAWQGMMHLSVPPSVNDTFSANTVQTLSKNFMQQRLAQVNAVLAHEPYVYLSGLSGVGKSTFVLETLAHHGNKIFVGEAAIADWAKSKAWLRHQVLFIDEANLSANDWSVFEGLYHKPPSILYKGTLYPISPRHKIIFAGNPLSYGDERKLPRFFERHGNAVVFQPLPAAFLYDRVLKPIFQRTPLQGKTEGVSRTLLELYQFICSCSDTDVLISPRELQMMALLIVSHQQRYPEDALQDVVAHTVYAIANNLVPAPHKEAFDRRFKPHSALPEHDKPSPTDSYATPSRQQARERITDLLALREFRRHAKNKAQKYGGLGGLVLEGEPGVGKSELVLQLLRQQGYQECYVNKPIHTEKPFYRLPVSWSIAEKTALLLKAFHEGAVVIIDEINSSPMMERLLNNLLMGKTPQGQSPKKPGFMIIGTQNPITMAGRRAASTALSRRFISLTLPAYTESEIQTILKQKGLPEDVALHLTQSYLKQVQYASLRQLSPAPTFRNLIKLADTVIKAYQRDNKRQLTAGESERIAHAVEAAALAINFPVDALRHSLFSRDDGTKPSLISSDDIPSHKLK